MESTSIARWIAWRTRRNQALAGSGEPLERLRHALTFWLDDRQRGQLLDWLKRRRRSGEPLVPN